MSDKPTPADELRQRVRDLIEKMKTDPTRLARQIGRSKDYVRDFLDGRKESLNAFTLRDIERVAEVEDGWLTSVAPVDPGETLQPNIVSKRNAEDYIYRSPDKKTIPMYPVREIFDSRDIFVERFKIDDLLIPPIIRNDDSAYAILMEGNSMLPAYEPGDILFMSPGMGMRRGSDAIAYNRLPAGERNFRSREPQTARILRVLDYNRESIRGFQFGEGGEFELPRDDWGGMIRIVGKYNKR